MENTELATKGVAFEGDLEGVASMKKLVSYETLDGGRLYTDEDMDYAIKLASDKKLTALCAMLMDKSKSAKIGKGANSEFVF